MRHELYTNEVETGRREKVKRERERIDWEVKSKKATEKACVAFETARTLVYFHQRT